MESQMSMVRSIRKAVKGLVFGDTLLPQEFTVGLKDPQTEIAVWLQGMGAPRDVTNRHSTACSAPFVICVSFDQGHDPNERDLNRLSLRYCERAGEKRILGEIGLKSAKGVAPVSVGGSKLFFFEARRSVNYCLPGIRLGAHYLLHEYSLRRSTNPSAMVMSFLERRAAIVTFIRPHPISLVSVADSQGRNMFTMNLMGELGDGRFGFALKENRTAAPIVERVRRLAISTVPLPQSRFVFEFTANHFKESIEWNQLPFETRLSSRFGVPVPAFAARVREMEVEDIRRLGSHNFFVSKMISDETFAQSEVVCAIHGFFQAWRLKGHRDELRASLADHWFNKRGSYAP